MHANTIKLPWNLFQLAFYCCTSIESFECLKLLSKLCGLSEESKTVKKRTSDRETQRIESKNKTTKKSQLENILISLNLCVQCACLRFRSEFHEFDSFVLLPPQIGCVCARFLLFRTTTNKQHTHFSHFD